MNPNIEAHFRELPEVEIGRSKLTIPFTHLDTFNAGELVPELVMEVLPGDTVNMKMSSIVRMMTPIAPVMDNAYMDVSFWFVPNRLVWDNWKKFMGENETAPWTSSYDGRIPKIEINGTTSSVSDIHVKSNITKGSIANHMGIPLTSYVFGTNKTQINALPFRGYSLIWNEFWRDENLQNPVVVLKNDTTQILLAHNETYDTEDQTKLWTNQSCKGGTSCLPVCKFHDYFTSCLPASQKGTAPMLPLNGTAPININQVRDTSNHKWIDDSDYTGQLLVGTDEGALVGTTLGKYVGNSTTETFTSIPASGYYNFVADLSNATGATITALRQCVQIQKYLEADARHGTRYVEWLQGHFGVTNPDYRLQRPEYLGGFRQTINMNQVIQNTPVIDSSTPLGTTGAYSVTAQNNDDVFTKSFTEHGYLFGLICVRNDNTYQQGVDRMWFRDTKFDFYVPEFANLSEQAVLNREIYLQGTSADTEAFGYQEAWAEYRFKNNQATGEMSSAYSQSLDIWHYADYYTEKPTLGDKWIRSDKANIERTLAVQEQDQFFGDFYFDMIWTRPMPVYSIPGLMDHH